MPNTQWQLLTGLACLQTKPEDDVPDPDILYVGAAVTYSTILIKVFVMLEYAVETGARWLLKTDDDAYINIPQTVQVLQPLARSVFEAWPP